MRRYSAAVASLLVFTFTTPSYGQPPGWVDCMWEGRTYACLDVPNVKLMLSQHLALSKATEKISLLEQKLTLVEGLNAKLVPTIELLVVQAEASNLQLSALKDELVRQDVDRTDIWTLALYTGASLLVGFAGGALTALVLIGSK